ncbi:MAG: protein-L-isoaspartate O-methyltransferase [Methanosarcinales archaeon Met12]|nr:MAG: protein-L-isoaspartate O-methyltransferase [Methanosarcinales archaeon Met12]
MEYKTKRDELIEGLKSYGIGEHVLKAMRAVPRHLFIPEEFRKYAYVDRPLPIGENQTISAPHMVAMMCDLLDIKKGMQILEIGAGYGYHAAIMAELVEDGHIYTVERLESLANAARENIELAGYSNVTVIIGDGTLGLPEHAPYDRISVACAAPDIPPPLLEQLKYGGKMVIPIGRYSQELYLVEKKDDVIKKRSGGVMFVPLMGRYGFRE